MSDNLEKQGVRASAKEETKRRIIQSGIKSFAHCGYHGTKVLSITQDANVANGTFYLHFKDKQALYLEIIRLAVAKLASGIFAAHSISGSAEDKERAEIKVVVKFAESNRDLMRIAVESLTAQIPVAADLFKPLMNIREAELKAGISSGNISSRIHPLIAARAEIGMILSVVCWWQENSHEVSREDVIETLVQLRKGWSVSDQPLDDIDSLLSQWDSRL